MLTKPKIAILDDYQGVALRCADWSGVQARADVTVLRRPLADGEVVETLREFEVLCAMRERRPLDADLLARLDRLRLIVTTGSANRSIDLGAAERRGIVVSATTNGAGRLATAEMTLALILACARRLRQERMAIDDGSWQAGLGRLLSGAVLGIVGLGGVGRHVARLARAFGMRVLAWSPRLTPERATEGLAECVGFEDLLRSSDFVSVHVAESPRTVGLIDAPALELMKDSAYLINTSRGSIVDEAALLSAIGQGRIAGAGLDVFEREPLPADHPLLGLPNVVLTPHVGYATEEVYADFFRGTVAAVTAYLDGAPISVLTAGGIG